MKKIILNTALSLFFTTCSFLANAEEIGKVKALNGAVSIDRAGQRSAAALGAPVYKNDRIVTGKGGTIGLLFEDDSRLSIGPDSTVVLDHFNFNKATDMGQFDVSLKKGTLSAVSGKITQRTPGAMKVSTPAAVLAVRGTEFSAKVDETTGQGAQK